MSSNDNDLERQIKSKEQELEKLTQEDNSSHKIKELSSEIEKLKNQSKGNSVNEKPVKNKIITYSIVGTLLVGVVGFYLAKKTKKLKTK